MQPRVDLTILDGALGIIPPSNGDIVAVVGPTSSGPVATPAAFARGADVRTSFTSGPAVEAACLLIELTGKPVVIVRTTASSPATETTLDEDDWTGTVVPTIASATAADDDYEVYLQIEDGGTLGTDGVTYRTSLDGGRTLSAVAELGTAESITIPTPAGLVKFDFAVVGTDLITLVNDIRTDFLAHIILTAGSVHGAADTSSDDGIGAAVSTVADAITRINQIRTGYEAHRVLTAGTVHGAADSTNAITLPAATTAPEAVALANEIKAKYGAHRVLTSGSVHGAADSTNVTAAANADAGTFVAGDVLTFRTLAATWSTSDLNVSLTALKNTTQTWNIALVVGAASATAVQALDAWLIALEAKNKFKYAICNVRIPDIGETEQEYYDSLATAFASIATVWVDVCAGSCKLLSSVSARQYRRPVAWIDAVRASSVDPGRDLADVTLGPLPSCQLTDANGNPDDHDETVYPGLDDLRFTTLRSFEGRPGVFINNPRILSGVGSDFIFVQFRRVMNIAAAALVSYLEDRLSSEIEVDPETGKITRAQAAELNNGATDRMADQLIPQRRATRVAYVVSLEDNVLSTFTITGEARIVPMGYVKIFRTTISFNNPALRTSSAVQ
jgi:hypothetical protein